MKKKIFKLYGHDCPLKSYPSPVVPIGKIGRDLVAIYYRPDTSKSPIMEKLARDCKFVRHRRPTSLPPFDPKRDRLFALGPEDLLVYPAKDRPKVYQQLLKNRKFAKKNPYLRFSMSKATGDNEHINRELAFCWSGLESISRGLADLWYTSSSQVQQQASAQGKQDNKVGKEKVGKSETACTDAERDRRVLVVEDDPAMLEAIADTLCFEGYDVLVARNGEEALEKMRSERKLKAMVLDIMLPKVNGFEVCKRTREMSRWKKLRIIMTTALGQAEDERRGRKAGADVYIRKPYDLSELLEQLEAS